MRLAAHRIGVLPALAALAAAAALAGCGGGDGGKPSGPDPNKVLACAQDHGLRGVTTGADEALGTTGGLALNAAPDNRIVVDFFDDPEAARSFSEDQGTFLGGAGGGGSSEVIDETVVIGTAAPGAEDQVAIVKSCIG